LAGRRRRWQLRRRHWIAGGKNPNPTARTDLNFADRDSSVGDTFAGLGDLGLPKLCMTQLHLHFPPIWPYTYYLYLFRFFLMQEAAGESEQLFICIRHQFQALALMR
jgi:hypothetical protein